LPEISNVIYYFDSEGYKPLYEIIIVYKDEKQPQKVADLLFGLPNFDNKEWRIKIQGVPGIWSWVYKNKLVVVANIPNTEWSEEWNKH